MVPTLRQARGPGKAGRATPRRRAPRRGRGLRRTGVNRHFFFGKAFGSKWHGLAKISGNANFRSIHFARLSDPGY
jgi:hypothetical protein